MDSAEKTQPDNIINLFNKEKKQNKKDEIPQEEHSLESEFSFEDIMKANEEKRRKLEKQRSNDNNKVKKSYNLKPKK